MVFVGLERSMYGGSWELAKALVKVYLTDVFFVSSVLPPPLGVLSGTSRPPTPTLSLKPAPPAPVRLSPAPPPGSSSLLKPLTVPPGYTFPSAAATTSTTTATVPTTAVPAPTPAPQRLILSPDMQARLPCKFPGTLRVRDFRWEEGLYALELKKKSLGT